MIWNDSALHIAAWAGMVDPFDPALVNPASIDLRLGAQYRLPHPGWCKANAWMDTSDWPRWGEQQEMGPEGIDLAPGQFILCCSLETVSIPVGAVAFLYSKSSTGRMGLEHLHCITGDTLIDVPRDVSKHPNGIAVSALAEKQEPFDVYAFDVQTMSFVLAKATAFKARRAAKVVRVSYEWMTGREWRRGSIVCTPDHRFLTLGGEWVEAKDALGKRLRPFPRGVDGRYPTIAPNPLAQTMIREHRFIVNALQAPPAGEWEVHHLDGNRLNNQPDNLAIVRRGEHQRIHSAGNNNPFYGKRHTETTRQRLSGTRQGKPLSAAHRRRLSEVHSGASNPRYLPISIGQITEAYTRAGTLEGAAKAMGVSEDTLLRKIRENGYRGAVDFRNAVAAQTNHKVYEVVCLPDPADTYDIHVPGYENFVANGVVIHNSGLGDPGFIGQWTWEFINVAPWPIRLTPGQRLMQMVVESLTAPAVRDYSQTGRYQGQTGATPAREVTA